MLKNSLITSIIFSGLFYQVRSYIFHCSHCAFPKLHKFTVHKNFNSKFSSLSCLSTIINSNNFDILALDFDGVICASSTESSSTAVLTAIKLWPEIRSNLTHSYETFVTMTLKKLRPIIETGYESIILVRYIMSLYDEMYKNDRSFSEEQSNNIAELIKINWNPSLRDKLINEFNSNKDFLISAFSSMRDYLIETDYRHWISLNEIYSGVNSIFQKFSNNTINYKIITTKQERYVRSILTANNLPIPLKSDIYDLENPFGNKVKVLEAVSNQWKDQHGNAPAIHFVEDRYETLALISETKSLNHVSLYLVDWGYNTEKQRMEAKSSKRIKLINYEQFGELISKFVL